MEPPEKVLGHPMVGVTPTGTYQANTVTPRRRWWWPWDLRPRLRAVATHDGRVVADQALGAGDSMTLTRDIDIHVDGRVVTTKRVVFHIKFEEP